MAWNLMRDVERRIDELRREILGPTDPGLLLPASAAVRSPSIDVADEGDEIVATVELPGVRRDDVVAEVEDGTLHVRARGVRDEEKSGRHWIRRERSAVAYDRRIPLPDEVSPEQCSASFEDGVLTVRLRKLDPSRRSAHRLEID